MTKLMKVALGSWLLVLGAGVATAGGESLRTAADTAPGYSFFTVGDSVAKFWRCDGVNGAKSGGYDINSVKSWADVAVKGPATVTFDWQVSSEKNYDKLHFYDNGSEKFTNISGEVSESKTYDITDSNTHVLKFEYTKDGSSKNGSDCGQGQSV